MRRHQGRDADGGVTTRSAGAGGDAAGTDHPGHAGSAGPVGVLVSADRYDLSES